MDDADAVAFKRKQHSSDSDSMSGTFPLRMEFQRAYDSVELCDLERLDLGCVAADYEKLLPHLKDFFYLETKIVDDKAAALCTHIPDRTGEEALLGLKAHLISSYQILIAQEAALKVTALTSLIEFGCCSMVSAALGILVYIEGSRTWTTITSFILFGLCLVYKLADYVAYFIETWFVVDDTDYERLMTEAKVDQSQTEYSRQMSR
jgi:hypothetical protein